MQPLKDRFKKQKTVKILIIRLKPVGDTVLISPVFRHLKRLYPQAQIHVVIYSFVYDVLRNNPHVDKIIVIKRNNWSRLFFYLKCLFQFYDIIIDFINTPTSMLISLFTHARVRIGRKKKRNFFYTYQIDSREKKYSPLLSLKLLQPLGLTDVNDYLPELHIDKKAELIAANLLNGMKIVKPVVGLFVSAKYPSRQYPAEHFARLGLLISEKTNRSVVFLFGKDDLDSLRTIQKIVRDRERIYFITPAITIGELAAVIARLDFFITNDTGPKHIATALNIPTLTIFSATDEKVWNPPDLKRFPVIRHKLKCAPCDKLECPQGTLQCMTDLKPEEVFKLFQRVFKKK